MDEAGPSGCDKTSIFWEAALEGDLRLLKQCAEDLDTGEGLVETFERVRDGSGRTALHIAAAAGKTEICQYLIEGPIFDVDVLDEKRIFANYLFFYTCLLYFRGLYIDRQIHRHT
ncbi:uncharacterized protein LOC105168801 [Sesamum indicum]|uniref:Uncharacterized protein LOC105168801 n=1 Tax=Sesamum indicum TaxID=4182 RepID=A0A8M8V6I4_SESIN|nr:uncharacterized protein LOC105168801 [Sesamum indicum]